MRTRIRKSRPLSEVGPPTSPQHQSLLLQMPAEIRNIIYEYCLTDVEVRIPIYSCNHNWGRSKPPSLLLACKQTYSETIRLYYKVSAFRINRSEKCSKKSDIYTINRLQKWIKKIGTERTSLLGNVRISGPNSNVRDTEADDSGLSRQAKTHKKWINHVYAVIGLPHGVIHTNIKFAMHKVWTSQPNETTKEFLTSTKWTEYGYVWIEAPSQRLKVLLPRLQTLEEALADDIPIRERVAIKDFQQLSKERLESSQKFAMEALQDKGWEVHARQKLLGIARELTTSALQSEKWAETAEEMLEKAELEKSKLREYINLIDSGPLPS